MSTPAVLKAIQPYLLIAKQFAARDAIVAYYSQLYAVQQGIKLAKGDASAKSYLLQIMDQAEVMKANLKGEEALVDESIAQAHIEEVALKLFDYADNEDRAAKFHKNMIKTFFSTTHIFAVLKQFGELSDEVSGKMSYAKWKAVEIDRCLKNGIVPTPGPPGGEEQGADAGLDPGDPLSGQQSDMPHPGQIPYPGAQPQPSYPSGLTPYPPYPTGPTPYPGSSPYPPGPSPHASSSSPYPPGPSYPAEPPGPAPSAYPSLDSNVKPTPVPRKTGSAAPQPAASTGPPSYDSTPPPSASVGGVSLTRAQTSAVQKYCKFASSALDYDDYSVAIDYLEKSLNLLRTGKEKP